jgi:hypothetical protein
MNLMARIVFGVFLFTVSFSTAESKQQRGGQQRSRQDQFYPKQSQLLDDRASDNDLIRAVNDRRRVNFVEGGSMVVTKLLPDDSSGLRHQKWVVRLSNGQQLQAVYNLDMCPRVSLKVGDRIAMGGQFVWTNQGGLLHWLHRDPRGNRPDGYVFANGKFYCDK